ncbi:MAG: hypothetical protein JWN03_1004 [Nocardia sp.]|uniref:hypothetical protein n=1 Tax=Nocardia sp. TaxID=1821 RepID=UPI00262D29C7|nr:hypothetical protein [Nocardia sp.]MCU1640729.1 hypothetical protein [Nocardia sp.]
MPPEPRAGVAVQLDLIRELMAVDPGLGARDLLLAARDARGGLPALVLSLAALEAVPMGTGARDELRRLTRRSETYRQLADRIADATGARVVKGPSLASYYPPGVLRSVGDLDIVVSDEPQLWQVLSLVLDAHPAHEALFTELPSAAGTQLYACVQWPGEDPLLDRDYRVEVSTFAFAGEPGLGPMRITLPADPAAADLLSLAEERFQRPFGIRDMLDLALVLTSGRAPEPRRLAEIAAAHRLTPELLELCERTAAYPALAGTVPAELISALREFADAEQALRCPEVPEAPDGPPCYGMQLTTPLRRGAGDRCERHRTGSEVVVRTPISDFLMVPGALVDPDAYERALAYLATLRTWPVRCATTTKG